MSLCALGIEKCDSHELLACDSMRGNLAPSLSLYLLVRFAYALLAFEVCISEALQDSYTFNFSLVEFIILGLG